MSFWHEFRPTKVFSRFSTKTHPIHYVRSETYVLGGFPPFGSSKCSFAKSGSWMPFWHEFELTKLFSSFLAKTQPIHYFRPKSHVLGIFAPFGCRKCTLAKSDPRMPLWHEFRPMKLCLSFSTKMHPTHYIWSKAHVLGGFAPLGCRKWLPQVHHCKIGSWDAVWARVCADETIVEFYSQNTSNPLL